ncbi:MAG: hypothetical protein AAB495_00310 [Patescibacteria group bacterium]
MPRRILKQVVYGGLYLAVLAAMAGALYFLKLKPSPSCFDGKRNGNELGVDCEGSCAKVCTPPDIRMPELVGPIRTITIPGSSGTASGVTVVQRIQNANTDFGVSKLPYRVAIFNRDRTASATVEGSASLYGGDVFQLVVPNIKPSGIGPFTAEVYLGTPTWTKSKDFVRPEVRVRDAKTTNETNLTVVRGIVVNQDIVSFPSLTISALFYDESEVLAGASRTILDRFGPQETREFSIFYPLIDHLDSTRTEVFLHPELRP